MSALLPLSKQTGEGLPKTTKTITKMTQFEKALAQVQEKSLSTPSVYVSGKEVDYFAYQVATHYFNLKVMASGMKFRNITFKQIKDYYGLKGRSAADCLSQMEEIRNRFTKQQ
jgi:hypothetical protein